MIHDLVEETVEVKDGMIAIPDRPGLGFTISERFLEAHAQSLMMKENNLLAELAAYLFSRSNAETGADAVGARAGRAFRRQPRPDPRGAGDPGSHAHRRAAGEIGHLSDHAAGERRGDGAVRQGRRAARPDPDLRDGGAEEDPRDQGGRARLLARHRGEFRAAARDPESLGGAARGRRRAGARGPRLPPGDRARHARTASSTRSAASTT